MSCRQVLGMVGLVAGFTLLAACGGHPPERPDLVNPPYLSALQQTGSEGWFRRQWQRYWTAPLLDAAYRELRAGRQAAAAEHLATYLRRDPSDHQVRAQYMLLLYELGRYREVLSVADRIVESVPDASLAHLYKAHAFRQLSVPDSAFVAYGRALEIGPLASADSSGVYRERALLGLKLGRHEAALAAANVLAEREERFQYLLWRGLALAGTGRQETAEKMLRRAADLAEGDEETRRAYRELAALQEAAGRPAAAADALSRVLARGPEDLSLRLRRARLRAASDDHSRAIKGYRRVLSEPDSALPASRTRLQRELANLTMEAGQWTDAIRLYESLLKRDPTDADVRRSLALAYEQVGEAASALRVLEPFTSDSAPLDFDLALRLGRLQAAAGDTAAAVRRLRSTVSRVPADSSRLTAELWGEIGFLEEGQGRSEAALTAWDRSLKLQPRQRSVRVARARLLLAEARSEEAVEDLRIVLRYGTDATEEPVEPTRADVQVLLAQAFERSGQEANAARVYKALLGALAETDPRRATVERRLATLYVDTERPGEAAELFRQAVEHGATPADSLLLQAGRAFELADQPRRAVSVYSQLGSDSVPASASVRAEAHHRSGVLEAEAGQWKEALRHFEIALETGDMPLSVRLQAARAADAAERPDRAIEHYRFVTDTARTVPDSLRYQGLVELGGVFEGSERPGKAAAVWRRALEIRPSPPLTLRLARVLIAEDKLSEAHRRLEAVSAEGLSTPQQAERWALLADVARRRDATRDQIQYLERSLELKATAPRMAELAYAHRRLGHLEEASGWFRRALERHENPGPIYADAGYVFERVGRFGDAADAFRNAIAYLQGQPSTISRSPTEQRLRHAYARVSNRYDAQAYLSYRSEPGGAAIGGAVRGALPSQAGIIGRARPFANRPELEAYGRLIWGLEPRSLRFNQESYQGGVGLRYQPLLSQSLFVGVERLMAVGQDALSTWMTRLQYSWQDATALELADEPANYTSVYLEADYLTPSPEFGIFYGQVRQGVQLQISDAVGLVPQAMAVLRRETTDGRISSYVEAGPGVTLQTRLGPSGSYGQPPIQAELRLEFVWGHFFENPAEPNYQSFQLGVFLGF